MDRKVIVLTPSEWDNRIGLGQAMQNAYNHTHYAVSKESTLQSILFRLKHELVSGEKSRDDLVSVIDSAIHISREITSEVRISQDYIGNISTMIGYKVNEELKMTKE